MNPRQARHAKWNHARLRREIRRNRAMRWFRLVFGEMCEIPLESVDFAKQVIARGCR